jgi:hypothetical protein
MRRKRRPEEKMKRLSTLFSLVLALTIGAPLQAAEEHRHEPSPSGTKPAEQSPGHSSAHGMHECMQRHQAAMTAVDQVTSMMESAKSSDDLAGIKAVIDQAQKQLAQVKENMAMCNHRMNMMEHRHGTDGMMKPATKSPH